MRQGQFELQVLVGGAPLPEMVTGSGVAYVESSFKTAVSYTVQVEEVRAVWTAAQRRHHHRQWRRACGGRPCRARRGRA
jgi:hypothetical protein